MAAQSRSVLALRNMIVELEENRSICASAWERSPCERTCLSIVWQLAFRDLRKPRQGNTELTETTEEDIGQRSLRFLR